MKTTTRLFTFDVPAGTEKVLTRHFVRDVDGAEHPVDREIDVPTYRTETLEFHPGDADEVMALTERAMLAEAEKKYGPGVRAVETRDIVTVE